MSNNKTMYHNVEGRVKWAKVHESTTDEYGGIEFWILDLYLDEKELKKYKSLGLSNKIYEDDEGNSYIRPRRVKYKEFGRIPNKTYIEQLPPQLFDKDFRPINVYARNNEAGEPDFGNLKSLVRYFDMNDKPEFTFGPTSEEVLIGNDSVVRINISSYPIQGGTSRASQLESITLLEHVPYTPTGATPEKDDTPKVNPATVEFPKKEEVDDEIPF